ncbi:MAG: histidine phosphatase family protein [Lachnospiraceae bacterium]|nr:histidine phosphatase family protein [Lachnospiraceae bacterium]
MVKIYLIRHGRQESELCNVDVPLADAGRRQAELCGQRLKEYGIKRLYSSNLIRAVETAEIINELLNVPYKRFDELEEMNFGFLTGLTDAQIKEQFGEFIAERKEMTSDLKFPGGECGQDVFDRAFPVIRDIAKEADSDNVESVAIVTHGGVIRSVLAGILGCGFENKLVFSRDLENCSLTQIDYDENKDRFYIERVNDYSHIEKEETLLRKYFKRCL